MRKIHIERRKISLLKDEIRKWFGEKVIDLVDFGILKLWYILRWV